MSTPNGRDDTASDVLRHHAARLTRYLENDALPDEAVREIASAQSVILRVSELLPTFKVRADELEPKSPEPEAQAVTEAQMRAAVKTLKSEARRWRALEAKAGPDVKLRAGDIARDFEVRAKVLERKIPRRPWGLYAVVAFAAYALGVLSVLGAAAWLTP